MQARIFYRTHQPPALDSASHLPEKVPASGRDDGCKKDCEQCALHSANFTSVRTTRSTPWNHGLLLLQPLQEEVANIAERQRMLAVLFAPLCRLPRRKGAAPKAQLSTPPSIRRIVEQFTLRNSTRDRTADAFAAVIDAVLANAIHQPVSTSRAVNHWSAAEGVEWHLLEILWNKLLQTHGRTRLLGLVAAQGKFNRQQAFMSDNSFMPRCRLSQ